MRVIFDTATGPQFARKLGGDHQIESRPGRTNCGTLIEFVGAAGVGKSKVLEHLGIELARRGIPYVNLEMISLDQGRWPSTRTLARSATTAWHMQPDSVRSYVRTIQNLYAYARRREITATSTAIHICSEGIFHKLRACYRTSKGLPMNELADQVFRVVDTPDVVVVLEASDKTILARRTSRSRRNDKFDLNSIREDILLLQKSIVAIEHIQKTVSPAMRIIQVNVDFFPAESAAASIADELDFRIDHAHAGRE